MKLQEVCQVVLVQRWVEVQLQVNLQAPLFHSCSALLSQLCIYRQYKSFSILHPRASVQQLIKPTRSISGSSRQYQRRTGGPNLTAFAESHIVEAVLLRACGAANLLNMVTGDVLKHPALNKTLSLRKIIYFAQADSNFIIRRAC